MYHSVHIEAGEEFTVEVHHGQGTPAIFEPMEMDGVHEWEQDFYEDTTVLVSFSGTPAIMLYETEDHR